MNRIRFGTTSLGTAEQEMLDACLESGFVSPGPLTEWFEKEMAQAHGYKYGVACNSGGSAILVAAKAAAKLYNVQTIAAPAVTYIQSIAPLIHAGLVVSLMDVQPTPHAEPRYETAPDWVDAYLPCHLLGRANRVHPPASPYKIVIEDCAESIYAPGVGLGHMCCLSFNSTHLITTGAGGMILTDDQKLRDYCWTLINHGRPEDRSQSSCAELENHYIFTEWGYSMKFSDIQAAVGLAQHGKRDRILSRRTANADFLISHLKDIPNLMLPETDGNTFMAFQVVVKDDSREALRAKLHEANIETRPLFPITTQPVVQDHFSIRKGQYPGAEFLNDHGFFFGVHQNLIAEDLLRIVEVVRKFYGV
jgi:dTDP-4-amino-4,6-dideoxygalactose transaminase